MGCNSIFHSPWLRQKTEEFQVRDHGNFCNVRFQWPGGSINAKQDADV